MSYRAYYRVTGADDGKPLGKVGLEPVAVNIQAHIDEAFAELARQGYRRGRASIWIGSHLGKTYLCFEAEEAWEVRASIRVVDTFLKNTGWRYDRILNANTHRAL